MAASEPEAAGGGGFEPVDHTADLALRIWAPDLEGLFRQAARGMMGLVTEPGAVRPEGQYELTIAGIDLEELLVSWLGELLYRLETEQLLLTECRRLRIERGPGGFRLTATMRGEPFDARRHRLAAEIKAATYHGLRIAPGTEGGYEVTVVFDT